MKHGALAWMMGLAVVAACGGKAIVDPPLGSGGAGSSTNNTVGTSSSANQTSATSAVNTTISVGTSSSGGGCNQLEQELRQALADATSCDACDPGPNPCGYLSGVQLTDPCGCPVPVNGGDSDAVQNAVAVYNDFVAGGCLLDCGAPCAVSSNPTCQVTGNACGGTCQP